LRDDFEKEVNKDKEHFKKRVEETMKCLSVFIALLFFVTVSFASILDFQNDFTKTTGLCFKPKISVKIIESDHYRPKITTEFKFYNYGVISAKGGIVFSEKEIKKETNSYVNLTLNVKKAIGKTIYEKFPNIVDKLDLSVGHGQKDKLSLEFCLEI
jgi:hypothetical protein